MFESNQGLRIASPLPCPTSPWVKSSVGSSTKSGSYQLNMLHEDVKWISDCMNLKIWQHFYVSKSDFDEDWHPNTCISTDLTPILYFDTSFMTNLGLLVAGCWFPSRRLGMFCHGCVEALQGFWRMASRWELNEYQLRHAYFNGKYRGIFLLQCLFTVPKCRPQDSWQTVWRDSFFLLTFCGAT